MLAAGGPPWGPAPTGSPAVSGPGRETLICPVCRPAPHGECEGRPVGARASGSPCSWGRGEAEPPRCPRREQGTPGGTESPGLVGLPLTGTETRPGRSLSLLFPEFLPPTLPPADLSPWPWRHRRHHPNSVPKPGRCDEESPWALQLRGTLLPEPGCCGGAGRRCSGALGEPGEEAPQQAHPPCPPPCAERSCMALPSTLEPKSPSGTADSGQLSCTVESELFATGLRRTWPPVQALPSAS